jgi:outer membrane cobalamin receptor
MVCLVFVRPLAALGRRGVVYAAINNHFDANYQYDAGYPMPGRNFVMV